MGGHHRRPSPHHLECQSAWGRFKQPRRTPPEAFLGGQSPESHVRGSLCLSPVRAILLHCVWSGVSSPAGVGLEHVQTACSGSPGTSEVLSPPQLHSRRKGTGGTTSGFCGSTRPLRSERNECKRGTAERRKRSAALGATGDRSAHSSVPGTDKFRTSFGCTSPRSRR